MLLKLQKFFGLHTLDNIHEISTMNVYRPHQKDRAKQGYGLSVKEFECVRYAP